MIRGVTRQTALCALGALSLPLSACGQSAFAKEVTPICLEDNTQAECACLVPALDDGLSDRVKTAFVTLRWELRPEPKDRERVNNERLRAAGVDPADGQAVASIRSEFRDTYYPLRDKLIERCGTVL